MAKKQYKYIEYQKNYQKQYYTKNKKILNQKGKQYYSKNKASILPKQKLKYYETEYYSKNKERILCYQKKRYNLNRDKIRAKAIIRNKQLRKDGYFKRYIKNRKLKDPLFYLKEKLRCSVWNSFKRISQNKPAKTEILLGCTWLEAKEHFERLFKPGMSWNNMNKWQIDHIKPVASFTEVDAHLMNHISNLQPLWIEEHKEKHNLAFIK